MQSKADCPEEQSTCSIW